MEKTREVDLTYRDQNTAVVTYSADWQNKTSEGRSERAKEEKDSDRVLEGAVFALCNKEDIVNAKGDVILKAGSTVWYGAVLRGDDGTLTIGENSNVQDNAVLHCDVGGAVMLGKSVTVGHSALVHGCTVGDGSLIGMHATLLNHCVVGKNCIIGAGALVPEAW